MKYLKKLVKDIFNLFDLDIKKKYNIEWNCWPEQKTIPIVFYEDDENFHISYNEAQIATQMVGSDNPLRRQRHYTLMQLLKGADFSNGDVVECGTFRGLSAYQFSKIINSEDIPVILHIFDSFEGLSEIEEEDKSYFVSNSYNELRSEFSCGEEHVRANLRDFNFIKYYKGWIPERFNEVKDKQFSFVHIDVDLYQPIKDSIEFFFPRLVTGGIMVFDDYGYTRQFPGAKKSIDEALELINVQHFISLPSGQAYLIK